MQLVLAEGQRALLVTEECLRGLVGGCPGRLQSPAERVVPGLPPPGDEQDALGRAGEPEHTCPVATFGRELNHGKGRFRR